MELCVSFTNFCIDFQGSTIPDEFKMAWIGEDDEEIDTTGHIIVSSMVPIQMVAKMKDHQKNTTKTKELYQNFLVNSAFSVRPLHFWKVKENREKTQAEAERLRSEINNLVPINITPNISVKIHAIFSMMDSKVVTGT